MGIIQSSSNIGILLTSLIISLVISKCISMDEYDDDIRIQFALNLEHLEAEFFLFGATGKGLDGVAPELAQGGPPPIGGQIANLDIVTRDIIYQFGLQEVGHLRAIKRQVEGFPRPLLNISKGVIGEAMDLAFGRRLFPPFDSYANSINYLLASYIIPYVGLTGYVGVTPQLQNSTSKKLVASLLGIEAGQDAVIRALLYERRKQIVFPYLVSVEEFTNRISMLRNKLGNGGLKDEGLEVPITDGAEGKVSGNILSADNNSLAFSRTPQEILKIVYASGDERNPGGFFPRGANGVIATSFFN